MQLVVSTKPDKCAGCVFYQNVIYGVESRKGYISENSIFSHKEYPMVQDVGIRQRTECIAMSVELSSDLAETTTHKCCPLVDIMDFFKAYDKIKTAGENKENEQQ